LKKGSFFKLGIRPFLRATKGRGITIMIIKKWNWKPYFIIVFFGAVLLLGAYAVSLLASGQVTDENGEALSPALVGFMCGMFLLIFGSYAITFVSMLTQVISQKGAAFCIDETGVRNTLVMVNLLAFVFVFRVKLIPWSAVYYVDTSEGAYIRVKRNEVKASFFGRLVLWIVGYHFCQSMITKKLTSEEQKQIETYCKTQSKYLEI